MEDKEFIEMIKEKIEDIKSQIIHITEKVHKNTFLLSSHIKRCTSSHSSSSSWANLIEICLCIGAGYGFIDCLYNILKFIIKLTR